MWSRTILLYSQVCNGTKPLCEVACSPPALPTAVFFSTNQPTKNGNLSGVQVAWKNHLHMLHPSPAAYAAYMGEVAMWTGIVTGSLMLLSPIMFERHGWGGVAGATPRFMVLTGVGAFVSEW